MNATTAEVLRAAYAAHAAAGTALWAAHGDRGREDATRKLRDAIGALEEMDKGRPRQETRAKAEQDVRDATGELRGLLNGLRCTQREAA